MSMDAQRTVGLFKQGLLDPVQAWQQHFAEGIPWQDTAKLLTGPLIVVYAVLAALLSAIFGGAFGGGFFSTLIFSLVSAAFGIVIGAFIFSLLAGALGGTANTSNAFAAFSLAAIPGVAGSVASLIVPFIGPLLALAGGILSLVYLYRLMPLALSVPDGKRVLHFILSLLGVIIINASLGALLNVGQSPDPYGMAGNPDSGTFSEQGSGVVGYMQRQGQIMEQATAATYSPPDDGRITRDQLKYQLEVRDKTRAAQERLTKRMEEAQKELEENPDAGFSSLSAIGSGLASAMGAQNAEMEIVVTGGGNWAEYTWVKNQLQTASIQGGEGSDAIAHNYKMLLPHREALGL
ncbi:MAG: Yip1 family protein [Pseudomonadota bacterium]